MCAKWENNDDPTTHESLLNEEGGKFLGVGRIWEREEVSYKEKDIGKY